MCTDGLEEEAASWFGTRQTALQVVSGLVLRLGGSEVVLQEGLDVLESGSLVRVFLPAQTHHLVQRLGTALRTWHPVTPLHLLQNLPVHHAYTEHIQKASTHEGQKCVDLNKSGNNYKTAAFLKTFTSSGFKTAQATLTLSDKGYKRNSNLTVTET